MFGLQDQAVFSFTCADTERRPCLKTISNDLVEGATHIRGEGTGGELMSRR